MNNANVLEESKNSLGLSSRVSKRYEGKTAEDVIQELDSISTREAYQIVSSYLRNSEFNPMDISHLDKYMFATVKICTGGQWYGGPLFGATVAIEMVDNDSSSPKPFFAFNISFERYDDQSHTKFVNTYIDWILPDADVVHTYGWHEIYQNYSSLPYEVSRHNISKAIQALEKLRELGKTFKSEIVAKLNSIDPKSAKLSDTIVENIAGKVFKEFKADDLFRYAGEHGALIAEGESYMPDTVKPIEILREAAKSEGSLPERLEESILNATGLRLVVKVNESRNKVDMTDESGLVKISKEVDSLKETVEEAVAKEAARLAKTKPSSLGFVKRMKNKAKNI